MSREQETGTPGLCCRVLPIFCARTRNAELISGSTPEGALLLFSAAAADVPRQNIGSLFEHGFLYTQSFHEH